MMTQRKYVNSVLPPKVKNITGQIFDYLTVKDFVKLSRNGAIWRCQCTCGTLKEVCGCDLRTGNTKSCGCMKPTLVARRSLKHGHCSGLNPKEYPRAYRIWKGIINRCYTKSSSAYHNYGGRGICVCDEWRNDFTAFYRQMGEPPDGYTIERIDVNGHYVKENCKWIPFADQARNRRSTVCVLLNGQKMLQVDAARKLGLSSATLCKWHKHKAVKPADIDLVFLSEEVTR